MADGLIFLRVRDCNGRSGLEGQLMLRHTLEYTDESAWLQLRAQDITSTETPSLFGHGRETPFELAHRKAGHIESAFKPNERTEIGKEIEAAIAARVARMYGMRIRPKKHYIRLPELRMGASFDFEIVGIGDEIIDDNRLRQAFGSLGPGLMEVKNVDTFVFRDNWITGDKPEAPPHIEIQLQHQLEVSGYAWGVIVAFVGGNHVEIVMRLHDVEVGSGLRFAVGKLWADLDRGVYPPVTYPEDLGVLKQIYGYSEPGKWLDARGSAADPILLEWLKEHEIAAAALKSAVDKKETAQAHILELIGDYEKVTTDIATISAGMVAPTTVPAYERRGYRNFQVRPKKQRSE